VPGGHSNKYPACLNTRSLWATLEAFTLADLYTMQTLFVNSQLVSDSFLFSYSLLASTEFIDCADKQLTEQFIKQTGIKPGKNVSISLSSHDIGGHLYGSYLIPNTNTLGRKLCVNLYVNHNWNPITIYWRSKSHRDYKLHEKDIDCNDIVFWFERLDTDLYLKQLFPKQKLPFKTDKLSFELEALRLNMDASLTLVRTPDSKKDTQEVIDEISQFINEFNEDSAMNDRKDGVVHNFHVVVEGEQIKLEMDLGSAGIEFYKGLLKKLSTMNCFSKVSIG
jgi:hypothetical protein